ncbi:Hsp20/alpha crystallin family protein [Halobacteriales archaeon Cl-PHB]
MSRRSDPFQEIERMFDQLTEFGGGMGQASVPVDVVDEGDAYTVTMDLPGYTSEDIDVQLSDARHLQVSASSEQSEESEGANYVTRERHSQSMGRTVALPEPVDETGTEATYTNGVLTVTLPKQEATGGGTDIPVS